MHILARLHVLLRYLTIYGLAALVVKHKSEALDHLLRDIGHNFPSLNCTSYVVVQNLYKSSETLNLNSMARPADQECPFLNEVVHLVLY